MNHSGWIAGASTLFLDEIQRVADWTRKLKSQWDRLRRHRIPLHVVATGSSALQMVTRSRETLAGRFERLTLGHWSAATLAHAFSLDAYEAADAFVKWGSYPGAFPLRLEPARWQDWPTFLTRGLLESV